jgi:voltage-gated potassium channel
VTRALTSLRHAVHRLLEGGQRTPTVVLVRGGLALLIVANVVAVVIETIPTLDDGTRRMLDDFEAVSLVVFVVEYLLRLWTAGVHAHYRGATGLLRFAVSPNALVDFVAIAPSLLVGLGFGVDLRVLRLLRLLRLLRIMKLGRYSLAMRTLRVVLWSKAPDLVSLSFVLLILLVLSSSLMFHLEHDTQPTVFSSIPTTMWWGIVTLTTIGYGDMAPVTVEGRLLGSFVALLGIGMFALPAGLLGAAFVDELAKARREAGAAKQRGKEQPTEPSPAHCPHCGHEI